MSVSVPRRPVLFVVSTIFLALGPILWLLVAAWAVSYAVEGDRNPGAFLLLCFISTLLFLPVTIVGWYVRRWTGAETRLPVERGSVTGGPPMRLVRGGADRLYPGVQYAYAAVLPLPAETSGAKCLVFTAGACPLDVDGEAVAPGDFRLQARRAAANLLEALAAAGAAREGIAKTTIYVVSAERADLVAAWQEIKAALGEHDPPSTLLGVAALGYPDQLVEIEAVALTAG